MTSKDMDWRLRDNESFCVDRQCAHHRHKTRYIKQTADNLMSFDGSNELVGYLSVCFEVRFFCCCVSFGW